MTRYVTHQSSTVYAECGLKVSELMKVVFEAASQGMAIGPDKVSLHLSFTDHSISARQNSSVNFHFTNVC